MQNNCVLIALKATLLIGLDFWNEASYDMYNSGASSRAKRAWDRAPYSYNMVNLFSFGCHVTDRAYVRTRLQIVRVG